MLKLKSSFNLIKSRQAIVTLLTLTPLLIAPAPTTAQQPPPAMPAQSTQISNANWEQQFGFPGSFHTVTSLGAGKQNVYAGLFFGGEVGKLNVKGIAKWDGGRWSAMGQGTDDPPSEFYVNSRPTSGTANSFYDDVYIVGGFEQVDGKSIGGVARWDDQAATWHAVGSGVGPRDSVDSATATAVTMIGNDLYIGGEFTKVDGKAISNIAKWDGTAWSAVGDYLEYEPTGNMGEVYALAGLPDGRLVVGGKFTRTYNTPGDNTGTPMNYITIWNPQTGTFTPLGSGLSSAPSDIEVVGNDIYVGGAFATAGGVAVKGIARWDGTKWAALSTGLANGGISSMTHFSNTLYIGGSFGGVGTANAHRIAKWDGATWLGLDDTNSEEDDITGVVVIGDGTLYAAGDMELFKGVLANNIARWSEAEQLWRTLGYGLANTSLAGDVSATYVMPDGKVLAAGDFGRAGGVSVNNLALWDPTKRQWSPFGQGADGAVNTIVRSGNLLYFGGAFTTIGGISAPKIATYDLVTGQWASLGTGLNGTVFAVAFALDGVAYVGGNFTATPNGPADRLALWNPATQTWSAPPFQFDNVSTFYTPSVFTILPDATGALIGGSFFRLRINGQLTDERFNGLFYWDRATNTVTRQGNGATYGDDLLGSVNALVHGPDGIYVGGRFDKIGAGIAANNAAKLTNAGWQPLGTGVNATSPTTPRILTMLRVGDLIFTGGEFFTAGNTTSTNAAVWNLTTNQWQALGEGIYGGDLDSEVVTIAAGPTAVYFGGEFWFAGDGQASSFAAWRFVPANITLDRFAYMPTLIR